MKKILLIIPIVIFASIFAVKEFNGKISNNNEEHKNGNHHDVDEHTDREFVDLSDSEIEEFDIQLSNASSEKLKTYLELTGEIVVNSDKLAHIVPRISGVANKVYKNLGDNVVKGEILASLQSKELANVKSEYLASIQILEIARANFNREEKLWKRKITPEQDYLNAKQHFAESQIALSSAKQKLRALGFSDKYLKNLEGGIEEDFTYFEIKSPFEGTVINKHITQGELLQENDIAYTISDLSSVWVNFTIYQKDLPYLSKGQKVVIQESNGLNETAGEISYISPVIGEETRSATTRVIIQNEANKWKPGLFVKGKVAIDDFEVEIAIPETALQTIGDQTVVFIRKEEGFFPQPVKTGRSDNNNIEIISGLETGAKYVLKGGLTLKSELQKDSFGEGHAH